MGLVMQQVTVEQYAELHGKQTDAVQVKLRRIFPGERFALDTELSADHLAALSVDRRTNAKRANVAPKVRARVVSDHTPKEKPQPQPAPEPEWVEVLVDKPAPEPEPEEETWTQEQERPFYRRAILIALLIAPTAASVSNMYSVTGEITGEPITAALYTVILSVSALGFTLSGVRSWVTVLLSVILIAYESFCNLTRLYYGLMGGVNGNPTRFLGTVTELFNSGSYGTAVLIAGFSALMLAAVQYTAIFEIQKR